ncbi:hypothetical protein D3C81_2249430 [compost metagenome]
MGKDLCSRIMRVTGVFLRSAIRVRQEQRKLPAGLDDPSAIDLERLEQGDDDTP